MTNYQNTTIYCLRIKSSQKNVYVGFTTLIPYTTVLTKIYNKTTMLYDKLYVDPYFNEFEIIKLEEYTCSKRIELIKRKEFWANKLNTIHPNGYNSIITKKNHKNNDGTIYYVNGYFGLKIYENFKRILLRFGARIDPINALKKCCEEKINYCAKHNIVCNPFDVLFENEKQKFYDKGILTLDDLNGKLRYRRSPRAGTIVYKNNKFKFQIKSYNKINVIYSISVGDNALESLKKCIQQKLQYCANRNIYCGSEEELLKELKRQFTKNGIIFV